MKAFVSGRRRDFTRLGWKRSLGANQQFILIKGQGWCNLPQTVEGEANILGGAWHNYPSQIAILEVRVEKNGWLEVSP
jgi:hypothetical protein